ncbi:hypothetical protein ZIOFF_056798 [Zingiber officinale]|uniref:O-methyltransferase C-terminal domain-containing protein n=1 Tax=Zingiber officinale TaxID=94328 RepID=A0A8J5FIE8_ZINOF|nr:hypothetical protein ZIOFF_056798 [Zingiber officinale]
MNYWMNNLESTTPEMINMLKTVEPSVKGEQKTVMLVDSFKKVPATHPLPGLTHSRVLRTEATGFEKHSEVLPSVEISVEEEDVFLSYRVESRRHGAEVKFFVLWGSGSIHDLGSSGVSCRQTQTSIDRGFGSRAKVMLSYADCEGDSPNNVAENQAVTSSGGQLLDDVTRSFYHVVGGCGSREEVRQQGAPRGSMTGVEHVGGDMFVSVPNGDVIFMKWILHDWSDEYCAKILEKCWKVLLEKGNETLLSTGLAGNSTILEADRKGSCSSRQRWHHLAEITMEQGNQR